MTKENSFCCKEKCQH